MKLLQEAVNIAALYSVFMQWYRRDRSRESDNVLEPTTTSK